MSFDPGKGDSLELNFRHGFQLDGSALIIDFGAGGVVVPPKPFKNTLANIGVRLPWGKLRPLDGRTSLPWKEKKPAPCPAFRFPWRDAPRLPISPTSSPWGTPAAMELRPTRLPWLDAPTVQVAPTRVPWNNPPAIKPKSMRLPWQEAKPHARPVRLPWASPGALLVLGTRVPWSEKLVQHNHPIRVPWWAKKPAKDNPIRVFWGKALYDLICRRGYVVPRGDRLIINLQQLLTRTGDGDHCDIWFDPLQYDRRCKQREPSGWRDNYLLARQPYPQTEKPEVWIVINTAWLTRVLDGKPVEVFSMELAADLDSWCWSFSATVPAASLELIMPLNEPVAVEANINGYTWRILVESWSESHAFGKRSYTVRGRSLSAELTEPYAPARAGSNEAEANAQQLAAEQLQYTDWTLQWNIADWLVPVGALSYSNATPLKIIQRIAEAAGGRIISHRTDRQLIALPRLHSLPWSWSVTTPALGINDYVVRTLSREFQPGVAFDAVFVSGETQGVSCKVYRQGTAATELAPMVTDALITDVEPARERGKLILGQSGKWSRESLELPLTRVGVLPGLLELGSLISMEERGVKWRGQVAGIRVSAQFGNSFTVNQSVTVERYRGK